MANRIVGLDIGTWTVKAVTIELERQIEVVNYHEVRLSEFGDRPTGWGVDGNIDGEEAGPQSGESGPAAPPWEQDDGEGEAGAGDTSQMFPEISDLSDETPADLEAGAELGDDGPGGEWNDDGPGPTEFDGPQGAEGFAEPVDLMPVWAKALQRLKDDGVFEDAHQVIVSFPSGKAVTLHVDVPFERPTDVAEILPHLLMDELPISLPNVVYDFIVIPGKKPDLWEALVGFVQREEMTTFLGQCRWAGIDPAVVGVPELMLRYAGDQVVDPGVESYGIIDMGHQFTRLLIMSEGKPVVAHTTRRGGAAVTEALAQNFQISEKEARKLKHQEGVVGAAAAGGDTQVRKLSGTIEESLRPVVREMRRTFQSAYAKYKVAVDAIYVCGGTSRLQGIEEYLHSEFEVDVQRLQLDQGLVWNVDADKRERMPEAAMALGSALQKPLDESDLKLIDFRQGEFVYRGKSSYLRTQMTRLGLIAAVLVVMIFGVLVMQQYDQRAKLAAMETAVAAQTQELFGEAVTSASDVQSRLEGEGGVDRSFVPQKSAYEMMYRIIEQVSRDIEVDLDRVEVDTDRSLIQLVGETESVHFVEQMAREIGQLECLSDVSTEKIQERDNRVQFELQITSQCS